MQRLRTWVANNKRWFIWAPILIFCLVQVYFFFRVAWMVNHNPSSTSFMRQQLAVLQEKNPNAKLQHKWVPYRRISLNLKRAVVVAEDINFASHHGVDWGSMRRAFKKNRKKGKIVAGGSTITQQLAKNLFLSSSRSYFRKGQEILITYMIEFWMEKERILELYMNMVEYGVGVFGAEAAARHYYGVSAAALSPNQAARLAALLPRPRYFDKHRGSGYLAHESAAILNKMGGARLPH